MGRRGTKPKPTTLKILHGERPQRVNQDEPRPILRRPKPPKYLNAVALEEWEEILPDIEATGVLSVVDGRALALYCESYSRLVAARADIDKEGVIASSEAGAPKTNPAVVVAERASVHMLRCLSEFGLTPAARSRVKAPAEGPKDELEAFLGEKKA